MAKRKDGRPRSVAGGIFGAEDGYGTVRIDNRWGLSNTDAAGESSESTSGPAADEK